MWKAMYYHVPFRVKEWYNYMAMLPKKERAVAQDNGYTLQVALFSGGMVGIAVGTVSVMCLLAWWGVNWIMMD